MADPSDEIPIDADFCERMIKAREKKQWTQGQLAAHVGTTQPTISAIERGGSSALIPKICRVLKIAGPMFGWTEQQKRWANTGHRLEEKSPATFRLAMTMIQQMLDELEGSPPTEGGDPPRPIAPPPPKKKATPIGRANVTEREPSRRLRAADELPGESKKKH